MTNEAGVRMREKEPLLPRWLKIVLVFLGVFLFLVVGGWILLDIITRQDLEATLAEMEAEGWPMSYAELAPGPVSDEGNASLLYEAAYVMISDADEQQLRELQDEIAEHREALPAGRWEALPAELQQRLRGFLLQQSPVLDCLSRAASMPRCRLPIEYVDPWPQYADNFPQLVTLSGLGGLAGFGALGDGHPQEAFEWWLALVTMAHHLEGHNLGGTELDRLICLRRALTLMAALIQSRALTRARVDEALEAWRDAEGSQEFLAGLRSRWLDIRVLFEPERQEVFAEWGMEPREGLDWRIYNSWLGRPWRQYELAYAIEEIRQEVATAEVRPFVDSRHLVQLSPLLPLPREPFGYGGIMIEVSPGWAVQSVYFDAEIKLTRAALALEGHRLAHGEYTDELEALVPRFLSELPADPFDGKPVRYLTEASRVVVYSVGRDLQDDGGSQEKGLSRRPKDIVFTVRRAAEPTEEAGDE